MLHYNFDTPFTNNEGSLNCSQVITLMFLCSLVKQHTAFKRKDVISGVHVSPATTTTI